MNNSIFRRTVCMAAALLMCLCSLILPGTVAYADNSAVEEAQYGVVRVLSDAYYYTNLGTGFAVGMLDDSAQIIVTNNHVVESRDFDVYVTITDINNVIPAEVLYLDPGKDLAVLKVSIPISERHPLPLLSPDELVKSQDVYCLGFPGNMDDFSERGDVVSSTISDLTITKGTVSNPEYALKGGVTCVLTDCAINHGNSGGPMVDEYGQVVGVNTWGIDENMNCAVRIDYVMEILDELGLPYVVGSPDGQIATGAEAGGEDGGNSGKSSTGFIIGGIAAVLVIAGVIVVMSGKNKKQPVEAAVGATVGQGYVPPAAPPAIPPAYNTNSGPTYVPPTQNKLYIYCDKGTLAGRRFSTTGGTIRIGRDAGRCQLVFPQTTAGISKLHCEVRFNGGIIQLCDLGSSYGTFLMSGTKLSPNVPVQLKDGESFYLASPETVLSVRIR